jgi:hypothetical protein
MAGSRPVALAATLGSLTLWSAFGRADEPKHLDLEWNAADGCPDRVEAEAAIREIIGQRATTEADVDFVKVDITRLAADRWEARIVTHAASDTGVRRFEGPSCKRVTEATILIVAMTLDPMGAAEQITTLRATEHAEAPPRAVESPGVMLGARVVGDVGSLPAPTLGVVGVLGIQSGSAHVEGEATVWLSRLADAPAPGPGFGEISLYTGGLHACWDAVQAFGGELRLGGCLGGEAGTSTGRGLYIPNPAPAQHGTWAAGLAGVSLRQVSSSGLTFWMSVDVGVPLRRPRFVIDASAGQHPLVFQASPVVGRASCGLAWIFR